MKKQHTYLYRTGSGTVRAPPRALGLTPCRWGLGRSCSEEEGGGGGGKGEVSPMAGDVGLPLSQQVGCWYP